MTEAKTINTRLVLRNADLSAWEKSIVQLLPGEMALARLPGELSNSYKVRIGTGDKTWNQLSDQGQLIIPAANVEGLEEKIQQLSTSFYECSAIGDLSGVYVNGDIAVEKKPISSDCDVKIWCAYRYSTETSSWQALDGNYSAENVYFKNDITLAGDYSSVGNVKLTDGTLSAKGKSVDTLMKNIFTKELSGSVKSKPSTSAASFKAKVNGAGDLVTASKSYEYGTYLTDVQFSGASFTKGSYTYGPDSEQSVTAWTAVGNNLAVTEGSTSSSGKCESVCIGDQGKDTDNETLSGYTTATSFSVKTTGSTAADTVEAKTNLGSTNSESGFDKVQFAANDNITGGNTSGAFTGYRLMFFGSKATAVSKTSDNIRGLSQSIAKDNKTDYAVTISEGTNQVLLAVPSDKKVTKVLDVNAFGTDVFSSFTSSTVQVEGANHYTAIAYTVYEMLPEATLGANTYKVTITNA